MPQMSEKQKKLLTKIINQTTEGLKFIAETLYNDFGELDKDRQKIIDLCNLISEETH